MIKNIVIGIDPGVNTGVAISIEGVLTELKSLNTYKTIEYIQNNKDCIKKTI